MTFTQRLSEMDRDLSFEPIVNARPRTLTVEQIGRYNEQGYIKPFQIFNTDEASKIAAYFDDLLDRLKQVDDGRDAYALNGYQNQCRGIYDLVTNPRVLDLVEDLLGPNIACWGAHFFCKMPGDHKSVKWHQDAMYWPFDKARTVTVWLAVDDVDIENGAMHVIPGTHKLGPIRHTDDRSDNVLDQAIDGAEKLGEPVPIELRAGEVSLHADMIAHGSGPNRSTRRRGGLTIRYCPANVRALSLGNGHPGWNSQSIICRGKDPSGHWANVPRPAGEDLTPKTWQINAA